MRVGSVSLLCLVGPGNEKPDNGAARNSGHPCPAEKFTFAVLLIIIIDTLAFVKISFKISSFHFKKYARKLLFLNCGLIGWVHKNYFWFLNPKWIMELVAILWFPYCEHYYSSLWTFFTNGHNCSKISPHQTEKYDVDTSSRCNCGNIKLEQKLSLF